MKVEIVTCYKAGTLPIMAAWVAAVGRHTKGDDCGFTVLVKKGEAEELKDGIPWMWPAKVVEVEVGSDCVSAARVHGKMLDAYLPSGVRADMVCTMDTDCFPVADGWIEGLVGMLEGGVRVAGILHPWAPPPDDMKRTRIEWRVRSQHCWRNTHVACQMLRTADLVAMGVGYSGGDDTGLLIPRKAQEMGWKVSGYMPTRCPVAAEGKLHPEFNRYVSLVYGDKVFHLGGYTRVSMGDKDVYEEEFGWAKKRVLAEKGAEFLLDDSLSYRFAFDREEDVAKEKMDRIFGTHTMTGMETLRVR
jgi:hypothetical protein